MVRMTVSAGALPEGFCPKSMQELFDAMVQRIIVTPNQVFTSFAMGSLEPTSNVGPWLKDCEEWFVWDDNTSRYRPIMKQGFNQMQYIQASTTFVVPEFIYSLKIHVWGAGGGGGIPAANGGSGGGAGGFGMSIVNVMPGQVIPIVIGTGGTGGNPGTAGGATTILGMVANGGGGGDNNANPGTGGTVNGAAFPITGGQGSNQLGSGYGGIGGMSPQGGPGGTSNLISTPSLDGRSPGGGGSGGTNGVLLGAAGSGANGGVLIEY